MEPQPPSVSAEEHEARGDALMAGGDLPGALLAYTQAVQLAPGMGRLHAKTGSAHFMMNRAEAAVLAFGRAQTMLPQSPAVLTNLGAALAAVKRFDEALPHLRRAVELRPDYSIGHHNLGRALTSVGDLQGAHNAFAKAVAADPTSVQALVGLGQANADLGQVAAARACFNRALQIDPRSSESLGNLGILTEQDGDLIAASAYYEQALACDPRNDHAVANLANVYMRLGRWADSRALSQEAIRRAPGAPLPWDNYLLGLDYDPSLTRQEIFEAYRDFESVLPSAPAPLARQRPSTGKIRVGYVSADFRSHACAYFLLPLLRAHDPSVVEIACYYNENVEDQVTLAFKAAVPHWRPIRGLDDAACARLVAEDGIDILVDCAGHSVGNRLGIFARRPAPHAVTMLGYGNTTGLRSIDYRFTDDALDPPAEGNAWATEKLLRLPHGFFTYDPLTATPAVMPPPVLKTGKLTFGSFNGIAKINDQVIGVWAHVLRAVGDGRLVLKDQHFKHASMRDRMAKKFAVHGVDMDQLVLLGPTPDRFAHLAALNDVDICLDTHPYGGATTTCDALWMGVPVITVCGDRYTARQTTSILRSVGLSDLVAPDTERFVALATQLAADPLRLGGLRTGMRARIAASILGTPRKLARDIENAYRDIVENRI